MHPPCRHFEPNTMFRFSVKWRVALNWRVFRRYQILMHRLAKVPETLGWPSSVSNSHC